MKSNLRHIKNTEEVKEVLNCVGLEYSCDVIFSLTVINLLLVFHTNMFHFTWQKLMTTKVLPKCHWINEKANTCNNGLVKLSPLASLEVI